ncbi:MAG: DUF3047 domain-containing protein [Alphaproteobacteria bacterium]
MWCVHIIRGINYSAAVAAILLWQQATRAGAGENLMPLDAAIPAPPAPWRLVQFDRKIPATRYRVREWDGITAIEAIAERSMALLARPVSVDLAATPILCWRWRVDAPLITADMGAKAGDDYAARVYLSFRIATPDLSIGTRMKLSLGRALYGPDTPDAALNYVWDNRNPAGTSRWNAYTDRARMVVVESGPDKAGVWVAERRDVQADFIEAFHILRVQLTSLAIASDTDNTGESAHAGFADFHFAPRGQACAFP